MNDDLRETYEKAFQEIHEIAVREWQNGGSELYGDIAGIIEECGAVPYDVHKAVRSVNLDELS